jgi:hypothetical protein
VVARVAWVLRVQFLVRLLTTLVVEVVVFMLAAVMAAAELAAVARQMLVVQQQTRVAAQAEAPAQTMVAQASSSSLTLPLKNSQVVLSLSVVATSFTLLTLLALLARSQRCLRLTWSLLVAAAGATTLVVVEAQAACCLVPAWPLTPTPLTSWPWALGALGHQVLSMVSTAPIRPSAWCQPPPWVVVAARLHPTRLALAAVQAVVALAWAEVVELVVLALLGRVMLVAQVLHQAAQTSLPLAVGAVLVLLVQTPRMALAAMVASGQPPLSLAHRPTTQVVAVVAQTELVLKAQAALVAVERLVLRVQQALQTLAVAVVADQLAVVATVALGLSSSVTPAQPSKWLVALSRSLVATSSTHSHRQATWLRSSMWATRCVSVRLRLLIW